MTVTSLIKIVIDTPQDVPNFLQSTIAALQKRDLSCTSGLSLMVRLSQQLRCGCASVIVQTVTIYAHAESAEDS